MTAAPISDLEIVQNMKYFFVVRNNFSLLQAS